ncbi:site-specific DNA-methyltransferase [Sulfuricurvum sp.]|uniref:site-specific DNA-methyltransferase n=1 Tax=Sulfuricurvum sp. TaxID=2025608 RepID=UPI002619ACFE|nr:site-specific DNA-methyltransferase [Sulfuricurvum sp.]MDD3596934.1 site-specific DNA-methyltransferase [Sulfuricurvum sp.]
MEKLNGETLNIVNDNIEKLKQLFPEAFKEGKVDFDILKSELGEMIETREERYSFTWNGKSEARRIAQTPSTGTLRPCPAESVDWDTTQNLFLEGDNLEVLKLLQKSYHAKVKMIYIDPPYNTGKEFIYPDNFHDNLDTYLQYTGQKDAEGKKFGTNAETSGRYHTNWLNMMYPRLKLARNLLRDDGVIFISIDDNEVHNLRKICDEIFGESNFIANIVWQKKVSPSNDSRFFSNDHEYILMFAKNKQEGVVQRLSRTEEHNQYYKNTDKDERGPWNSTAATCNKNNIERPNLYYPITNPYTHQEIWPRKEAVWAFSKDTMQQLINDNRLYWGADGQSASPRIKNFLSEAKKVVPRSILQYKDVGHTQSATNEMKNLFPESSFDYPKPSTLITHLCNVALGDLQDTIVMDFFAGSSTTAHAVIKLNAEDGGNRRCISVQLPEPTDEKSEAYKAGYKTIAEISKERIRRAAKKIAEENPQFKGDLGFKVFKLDSSNIKSWDADFANVEQSLLDAVDNIKSDRTSEDLLYEILLKYGLDLTLPIETRDVAGKRAYILGYGALIICLDDDVTLDTVSAIAALKQEFNSDITRVVFKDGGFANDVVKTNAIQMLKQHGIDDVKSV